MQLRMDLLVDWTNSDQGDELPNGPNKQFAGQDRASMYYSRLNYVILFSFQG